jgi:hypothetical protein
LTDTEVENEHLKTVIIALNQKVIVSKALLSQVLEDVRFDLRNT